MKKIKITIEGMHCASCAGHVEKNLSKLGARNISVNPIMGKAFAEVEDSVTEEQLKKAIKDPGFEPKLIEFD